MSETTITTTTASAPAPPTEMEQELATKEVREVAVQLNTITNAIRKLAVSSRCSDGKDDKNTIKVSAMKITGLPESAQPKIELQLSSPIESKIITRLYDSNVDDDNDGDDDKQETETEQKKEEGEEQGEEETATVDDTKADNGSSSYYAIFEGVDLSVATLTVQVSDLDIPLGSSVMYDIAPLCDVDVLSGVIEKTTQLEVAIVPEDGTFHVGSPSSEKQDDDIEEIVAESSDESAVVVEKSDDIEGKDDEDKKDEGRKETEGGESESENFQDAISSEDDESSSKVQESKEVEKEDNNDNDDEKKVTEAAEQKDKDEATSSNNEQEEAKESTEEQPKQGDSPSSPDSIIVPTCVVYLKIEYNASASDQKAILDEKYNATVARKAVAMEKLRKIAISLRRAQMAEASKQQKDDNTKPSVKPGFLNKQTKKKGPMFLVRWYEKTIGPNSLLRKVYPIAKNYVLFFGGIILMHYQGHQLALPPPSAV
mmetsp:Transcript_2112/g.2864  ORF Transcript_2112/g.2864 Transcript_2112/m.2864 type:complete len:484 (-) Transcript_2112:188-1639(-)